MVRTRDPNVIDDDNPEWTDADFARTRPFSEMFPEQARSLKNQGGRPKLERPEIHVGFRLAADGWKASRRPAEATMPASNRCCATRWPMGSCDRGTVI